MKKTLTAAAIVLVATALPVQAEEYSPQRRAAAAAYVKNETLVWDTFMLGYKNVPETAQFLEDGKAEILHCLSKKAYQDDYLITLLGKAADEFKTKVQEGAESGKVGESSALGKFLKYTFQETKACALEYVELQSVNVGI